MKYRDLPCTFYFILTSAPWGRLLNCFILGSFKVFLGSASPKKKWVPFEAVHVVVILKLSPAGKLHRMPESRTFLFFTICQGTPFSIWSDTFLIVILTVTTFPGFASRGETLNLVTLTISSFLLSIVLIFFKFSFFLINPDRVKFVKIYKIILNFIRIF